MSRKTRRAPKARRISPTPLVTADDLERVWAALDRPDRSPEGYGHDRADGWRRPGAVARFMSITHQMLHEITLGLNALMENVDAVARSAELRPDPMGDGFDFAAARDLIRATDNMIGGYLTDQHWQDACDADEELACREDARLAARGTPRPPVVELPPGVALGIPVVGDIDADDLARMFNGEAVDTPVLRELDRRLTGGPKKPARALAGGGHRL